MKKHHLDDLIKKLKRISDEDGELDISIAQLFLIAFQEIKETDETLQNLSDEIRGYDP